MTGEWQKKYFLLVPFTSWKWIIEIQTVNNSARWATHCRCLTSGSCRKQSWENSTRASDSISPCHPAGRLTGLSVMLSEFSWLTGTFTADWAGWAEQQSHSREVSITSGAGNSSLSSLMALDQTADQVGLRNSPLVFNVLFCLLCYRGGGMCQIDRKIP